MKRIIAALAVLTVLATGALAQTSDPYNNPSSTPTNTSTTDNDNTLADPNATTTTTTDADMDDENLPATASPLPLLALSGMSMLASGAWLVRRRRHG